MSSSGAPEPAEFDSGSGPSFGEEARELLSDPTGYIREIVLSTIAGSVLSILTYAISTGFDMLGVIQSQLGRAGGAITGDVASVWSTAAMLVGLPLETVGRVADSAGLFGPVVVALAFFLTAAIAGALVWTVYRVVRFI